MTLTHVDTHTAAETLKSQTVKYDLQLKVNVAPEYLSEHSNPFDQQYVWSYEIKIINNSESGVQLLNRFWQITDGNGHNREVKGSGVVGVQPHLAPGQTFSYSSFTSLATPSGIMRGHYEFLTDNGESAFAEIPAFSLDSPEQMVMPN